MNGWCVCFSSLYKAGGLAIKMDYRTLERAAADDRGNAQILIEELMAQIYELECMLTIEGDEDVDVAVVVDEP
jgi:hypothetical protein